MSSFFREMRENLDQIIRMHKLNLELLEQLDVVCGWLIKNNKQIPNEDIFKSLMSKAKSLLNEIYSPPTMQHQKQTPEDATKPMQPIFIRSKRSISGL